VRHIRTKILKHTYIYANIPIRTYTSFSTAPPGRFALFADAGLRWSFPFGTKIKLYDADSDPVEITDRKSSEFQFVYGSGMAFKSGRIFYLRVAVPFGNFAAGVGRLGQYETGLSAMF
jgi:hypothetical protein